MIPLHDDIIKKLLKYNMCEILCANCNNIVQTQSSHNCSCGNISIYRDSKLHYYKHGLVVKCYCLLGITLKIDIDYIIRMFFYETEIELYISKNINNKDTLLCYLNSDNAGDNVIPFSNLSNPTITNQELETIITFL